MKKATKKAPKKSKKKKVNYVSVAQYARLCGNLRPMAIYLRIRDKKLKAKTIKQNGRPVKVIDTVANPPMKGTPGPKAFSGSGK